MARFNRQGSYLRAQATNKNPPRGRVVGLSQAAGSPNLRAEIGQIRPANYVDAMAGTNLKQTQRGIGNVNRMAQFIHSQSFSRLR